MIKGFNDVALRPAALLHDAIFAEERLLAVALLEWNLVFLDVDLTN